MDQKKLPQQLVELIIAIIGTITAIVNIGTFVKEVKEIFEIAGFPSPVNQYIPYILFSWGIMASLVGGALWGLIWKTLGDKKEPHGFNSVLWAAVTNLITILSFIYVGKTFLQIEMLKLAVISAGYMIGVCMGAWIFYSVPFRTNGIRNYFEQSDRSEKGKNRLRWNEIWLVLIWSSLIAIPAFILVQGMKVVIFGYALAPQLYIFLRQVVMVILFTSITVWSFLLIYPSVRKHAMARGLIAGITLRTTLFLGLFMGLAS